MIAYISGKLLLKMLDAYDAGFRYFTDDQEFRHYVEREILALEMV